MGNTAFFNIHLESEPFIMYNLTREQFRAKSSEGNLIPVYREILADRLTPVSAFEAIAGEGYAFLLESVEGGERLARYSFLGADPFLVLRGKGATVTITEGRRSHTSVLAPGDDLLTVLKDLMGRYHLVPVEGLPRFCGGAVGYLAYDMVRFFERLPETTVDDLDIDDGCLLFTDSLLIFDHVKHRIKVLCNARIAGDPDAAYDAAIARIETLIQQLKAPPLLSAPVKSGGEDPSPLKVESNLTQERYEAIVRRCKEYIAAGDAFQIVPSQRFKITYHARPFEIYRALRSINPSPYMYYLALGDKYIVGSSPEILVTVERDRVRVRPIAGTRRRGADEVEDAALEAELLADEKERAEHIMLVDLGRNDVGRVSEYGTVKVDELMVIERYSHVMHIVSNVSGRLSPDRDVFDVLRACFPAGTVSGAPKVRAMEIIEEMEPTRRGVYAGAVGYFSFTGDMDTAIAIRTVLLKDGTAYVQAGGGVVADSNPTTEYQESCNKAKAVIHAFELAEAGLD